MKILHPLSAAEGLPVTPHLRKPEPFLKWAGGKRQLLAQFDPLFPKPGSYGTYHEPFVGGGAVFFHLRPKRARLADTNPALIEAYQVIAESVEAVIDYLETCRHTEDFYYRLRGLDPDQLDPVRRVGRLLFLNRTGYNGLYRVNRAGQFNVPFGRYKNPTICDAANLRAVAAALAVVSLKVQSFEAVYDQAVSGDFVYFDPPYQPLSKTAAFTAYTKGSFSETDQKALADIFEALDQKGCRVRLSNSDTPFVRKLYRRHRIETVWATRRINSVAARRGHISEVRNVSTTLRHFSFDISLSVRSRLGSVSVG